MSRLDDRLERDLQHIADRATPSSTAWEAIQTRVAEQADHTELEITMLKPNPKPNPPARTWMLGAVAAAVLIIAGLYLALSGGDDNSLPVTETDTTEVPVTTDAPITTTAAPTTTAVVNTETADLVVAEGFIAARNEYDGGRLFSLFADDAFVRDDLRRTVDGDFVGHDEIDYVFSADLDRVTGVELVDSACIPGSPGRVRCTYTWQSAWSKALGDDRYPNNSFVFDITDGQITGMTNTFAQGPVDGFDNHISEVTTRWLQEIHPDDVAVMFDESGLARNSAESLTLWQTHTEEFVTSLTGVGDVTIETSISVDLVEGERVDGTGSGTFAVTGGAGSLGCSAGTVAEVYSFQVSVEKVMTCTGGPRAGTFTISAGGALPGGAASTWEIVDSTGDFAGLTGSGPYLGRDVELDETTANPIYVFASVSEYTDEIVGTIEFG